MIAVTAVVADRLRFLTRLQLIGHPLSLSIFRAGIGTSSGSMPFSIFITFDLNIPLLCRLEFLYPRSSMVQAGTGVHRQTPARLALRPAYFAGVVSWFK
jgi:hypothetical protein